MCLLAMRVFDVRACGGQVPSPTYASASLQALLRHSPPSATRKNNTTVHVSCDALKEAASAIGPCMMLHHSVLH